MLIGLQGAFHAEQLWEAGFKGAGVKMGVFDTGIRLDHPHVKNIRCCFCFVAHRKLGLLRCAAHTSVCTWTWLKVVQLR